MSFTSGPCPRCGQNTMYANRAPTPCSGCLIAETSDHKKQQIASAIKNATKTGNRQQRRAESALLKKLYRKSRPVA